MKPWVGTGGCLGGVLLALTACAGNTLQPGAPASEPEGVWVEARQNVHVSDRPLGDVVIGDLKEGERATALCFVAQAQTNAGFEGSAIKVEAGSLSGYAAVTDFPEDPMDRQMVFNLDAETLRDRLPSCPS
jgi:hypothetical protein